MQEEGVGKQRQWLRDMVEGIGTRGMYQMLRTIAVRELLEGRYRIRVDGLFDILSWGMPMNGRRRHTDNV